MKKMNIFSNGTKGMSLATTIVIGSAITIGLVLLLLDRVIFGWFDVTTVVKENDIDRHAFTFANVLISSDKLAYYNGNQILRGVFDKGKLDSISNNPKILFDKLSYPSSSVTVTVQDLDSNNKWSFSGNGPQSSAAIQQETKTFEVSLPVVIRFSENELHVGKMTLKLTENSLS